MVSNSKTIKAFYGSIYETKIGIHKWISTLGLKLH